MKRLCSFWNTGVFTSGYGIEAEWKRRKLLMCLYGISTGTSVPQITMDWISSRGMGWSKSAP